MMKKLAEASFSLSDGFRILIRVLLGFRVADEVPVLMRFQGLMGFWGMGPIEALLALLSVS